MAASEEWIDIGSASELGQQTLKPIEAGAVKIALSCVNGAFGAVHNACNHVGGPLGEGALDGDYIVCPWHQWKFHRVSGLGEPGFEEDRVPAFPVKVENGRVLLQLKPTKRQKKPHEPHPLARPIRRADGPIRVAGISTTAMDKGAPRYSGSDDLLGIALKGAEAQGCETQLIKLNDLKFRACEGYYSKAAHACTWPCSITQMRPKDELTPVYEALVHWADAVIIATPIRWGQASSLYFRMAERMNCIQNQVTTHNRVLIRNKVASFIIVGGQDNVQGVAGQMLGFFAELGFHFPQFPYIAHSRGWAAEDMERNVAEVRTSEELHKGAADLAERTVALARRLLDTEPAERIVRGGRKAHALD
ncbi:Rieske 2Fe-2S domain-containing protein [Nordella sp. HKS 07]|uniref:Rieske 2Fe-2S domain-containing protein n=1 Tax=Nordella sp. HKS 07 TaxID=2712222 RepID=UPI0013E18013|nr:Rieske 2Fe-2S domain-containing protein [Nordella sp. HKS 07]QIG51761.1 Rieske 2Fe-2S domain-containing protein [Nordella sp. HKS 07]